MNDSNEKTKIVCSDKSKHKKRYEFSQSYTYERHLQQFGCKRKDII